MQEPPPKFPELMRTLSTRSSVYKDFDYLEFMTSKERDFQDLDEEIKLLQDRFKEEMRNLSATKSDDSDDEPRDTIGIIVYLNSDFYVDTVSYFEKENKEYQTGDKIIPAIQFKSIRGEEGLSGSIRVPHHTKIHKSWWGSAISPEIDPYILRICNACGLSPAQAWDHKPITPIEWNRYERNYQLHEPTRDRMGRIRVRERASKRSARFIDGVKVASDMETARIIFRNDHDLRKSQLIKQLEVQGVRCIKLACPNLREVPLNIFWSTDNSPELQESFIQIVAQCYLIAEALKAKRYMMQKTWSRLMKTRSHYVRDFWGATFEGGHLRLDYELLTRKRKR